MAGFHLNEGGTVKRIFLLLLTAAFTNSVWAQTTKYRTPKRCKEEATAVSLPPQTLDQTKVASWAEEIRNEVAPHLPIRGLSTLDWQNYVNCYHFVDFDADPMAEGVVPYSYNYSW